MQKIITFFFITISFAYTKDTSRTVETYKNGNISNILYHKDTPEGLELIKQETFHYTGSKSMIGTFKGGQRQGTWTHWYENGQIRLQGKYINGQKYEEYTLKSLSNKEMVKYRKKLTDAALSILAK